jgi:uncharacterized repeat protein (TIGR03943 family)
VVLLLVGGAVLRASAGDLFLRYVKSGLRPFLIIAGLLLVVTAAMTLWHHLRGAEDDDHHHPKVAWLLVLPVFGLLLITPPPLGAYSARRTGTILTSVSAVRPLPPGDPVPLTVIDYAKHAEYDHGRSLGSRRVRLTGFVVDGAGGRRYLARIFISCCAADAGPVKVGLDGTLPAGTKPDTWLSVTGVYAPAVVRDEVNGGLIPYLKVLDAHEIVAPAERYES